MIASNFGADAVYLWVPFTSLRMRQNKVKTFQEVQDLITDLHSNWTKAYLTMNIFPRNEDIKVFESVVEKVSDLWADAIIFSDPWTYKIIRKYMPNISLHLSTQTNTLNYQSVQFWYDLWVSRIVLARELTLPEIAKIKENVPNMELEIFAHWAMCMSYSGRCLLGEYFAGRDANKWECPHVCRYKYKIYMEEEKRPWKLYEITEEDGTTFIISSKDLCTINRIAEMMPYVDGLKIEWRSKWEFYVGSVVKAYRLAIDSILAWNRLPEESLRLLDNVPHRPYWEWFLFGNRKTDFPEKEEASISHDSAWPVKGKQYVGLIEKESIIVNGEKYYAFVPKDNVQIWDKYSFISQDSSWELTIKSILDENQNIIDKLHCNKPKWYISLGIENNSWIILYK